MDQTLVTKSDLGFNYIEIVHQAKATKECFSKGQKFYRSSHDLTLINCTVAESHPSCNYKKGC